MAENELITIKQLPIIAEKLHEIKQEFEKAAAENYALEVSESSLQEAKKRRAAMTKIYNDLEERRKAVKKQILAPYEEFEKVYQECVSSIYKPCDKEMAERISEIERSLKSKKEEELNAYFDELCKAEGIDFLILSDSGININLSTSMKKLREQVDSFIERIKDDLKLIAIQENAAEILAEYKATLNASTAITTIAERHQAIEREKARLEELEQRKQHEADSEQRAKDAIEEFAPPKIEKATEPEKLYQVTFTVRGTMEKIKQLKDFLEKGAYDYEQ